MNVESLCQSDTSSTSDFVERLARAGGRFRLCFAFIVVHQKSSSVLNLGLLHGLVSESRTFDLAQAVKV